MQGEAAVQAGNLPEAEGFFLRAKQPAAALAMYRKVRMWSEALRIAEDYLPDRVRTSSLGCSGRTLFWQSKTVGYARAQLGSPCMSPQVMKYKMHVDPCVLAKQTHSKVGLPLSLCCLNLYAALP